MAMEYRNLMEDIVLNHLTPHYVATRQGRLMVKLQSYELQSRADVVAALSEAAVMVAKTPRHGRE